MAKLQFWCTLLLSVALLLTGTAEILPDGRGKTPPMGWRSWNLYGGRVSQALMERAMHGLVAKRRTLDGELKSYCDLGYCEVGLDDVWQKCNGSSPLKYHDATGKPIVNTKKFPDLRKMTDQAHELGLKAGWYANNCACHETKTAGVKFYEGDVEATLEYGFDSIKLDGCGAQMNISLWNELFEKNSKSGILIENCHQNPKTPSKSSRSCPYNFYRTSHDIHPSYGSIVGNLQTVMPFAENGLSRPGCWAYPDMLEVGVDPRLSVEELRSHFGAWCIVSSPLILSHDLSNEKVNEIVWPIAGNPEAIAINQDWAGHSGSVFKSSPELISLELPEETSSTSRSNSNSNNAVNAWQYFYKPLSGKKTAVLLMNHGSKLLNMSLHFADIPTVEGDLCRVRDVWQRKLLGEFRGSYEALHVKSHDCRFYVLSCSEKELFTEELMRS